MGPTMQFTLPEVFFHFLFAYFFFFLVNIPCTILFLCFSNPLRPSSLIACPLLTPQEMHSLVVVTDHKQRPAAPPPRLGCVCVFGGGGVPSTGLIWVLTELLSKSCLKGQAQESPVFLVPYLISVSTECGQILRMGRDHNYLEGKPEISPICRIFVLLFC